MSCSYTSSVLDAQIQGIDPEKQHFDSTALLQRLSKSSTTWNTGTNFKVIEVAAYEGLIVVQLQHGIVMVFNMASSERQCILNDSGEIIFSIHMNKAAGMLLTVGSCASFDLQLRCRAISLSDLHAGKTNCRRSYFSSESLILPDSYIEVAESGTALTRSRDTFKVWDLATGAERFSFSREGVYEAWQTPHGILTAMDTKKPNAAADGDNTTTTSNNPSTSRAAHCDSQKQQQQAVQNNVLELKLRDIQTGVVTAEVVLPLEPSPIQQRQQQQSAAEEESDNDDTTATTGLQLLQPVSDCLLYKQIGHPLKLLHLATGKHKVLGHSDNNPASYVVYNPDMQSNDAFLLILASSIEAWNLHGEQLGCIKGVDSTLHLRDSNCLVYMSGRQHAFLIAGSFGSDVNVYDCLKSKLLTRVRTEHGLDPLKRASALYYDEQRNELYIGTLDGQIELWS